MKKPNIAVLGATGVVGREIFFGGGVEGLM